MEAREDRSHGMMGNSKRQQRSRRWYVCEVRRLAGVANVPGAIGDGRLLAAGHRLVDPEDMVALAPLWIRWYQSAVARPFRPGSLSNPDPSGLFILWLSMGKPESVPAWLKGHGGLASRWAAACMNGRSLKPSRRRLALACRAVRALDSNPVEVPGVRVSERTLRWLEAGMDVSSTAERATAWFEAKCAADAFVKMNLL